MSKIVFIGAGNVVRNMSSSVIKAGHTILQFIGKNSNKSKILSEQYNCEYTNSLNDINQEGDIYIISVSDDEIIEVLKSLKLKKDKIVTHTSGSVSIDIFKDYFNKYGVIYPLQTFYAENKIDFKEVPLLIEANDFKAKEKIFDFAKSISNNVFEISSEKRMIIHIAAVFAINFTNHLITISYDILKREKIPVDILKPIIVESSKKYYNYFPDKLQTGPAKRKDYKIIKKHIDYLKKVNIDYCKIYKEITDNIISYYN